MVQRWDGPTVIYIEGEAQAADDTFGCSLFVNDHTVANKGLLGGRELDEHGVAKVAENVGPNPSPLSPTSVRPGPARAVQLI